MINSPLRYPGGKAKALKKLLPLFPKFNEYREPFLGGGSVLTRIRQLYPNKKLWGNDIHYDLYKFWDIAKSHKYDLVHKVLKWKEQFPNGRELYEFITKNKDYFNDLETGAAFYVINRITFSGTSLAGDFSQVTFDKKFDIDSIYRLGSFTSLLDNVKLTNLDYSEVVSPPGDHVFIYLDPPYYNNERGVVYSTNGDINTKFDHQRLADTIKDCPHKWLITYEDSEYIRDLFSFANIKSFDLTSGVNADPEAKGTGKAVIISNFV